MHASLPQQDAARARAKLLRSLVTSIRGRNVTLEPLFITRLSAMGQGLARRSLLRRSFAAGQLAVSQGQEVSGAYFVLSGRLRVFTQTADGKEAALYLLQPGETCILALNSLFNDLAYPAWVEAETDTELAIVSGAAYRQLFASEPEVQNITVKALSGLVFRLMAEIQDIHGSTLQQRLVHCLLARASSKGEVAMTQQALANHLGSTREVVARAVAGLASRGLLQSRRGRITLLDVNGLVSAGSC